MRSIKTMVKDKVVRFKFYREGELFYETDMAEDKALLFMRYIRKHLASLEEAREESEFQGLNVS